MKPVINLIFVFSFYSLVAQQVRLGGFVYDAQTGEKIVNANVYVKNLSVGTTTNEYGYYSLQVPANKNLELVAGYVGYLNQEKAIKVTADLQVNFRLKPDNALEEVILEVKKQKDFTGKKLSTLNLPVTQIKKMPAIGGEPDLMKAFQLMPGVSSGKEGSSDLFVRGGSPDQNLVLLDDVPLYYVNHLGGFASVFNIDAIQSVELLKGGFPARYGNRLSSVVDIRMKEGNRFKRKTSYSIGMLNAKFMREGPLNDKMSYMLSVRRFLYDLISVPVFYIGTDGSFAVGYYFYDINAKLNYEINDKHHLYFSLYSGDDHFYTRTFPNKYNSSIYADRKSKYSKIWGNKMAALRWHYVINNQTDMFSVLSYSQYRMYIGKKITSTDDNLDYRNYLNSKIQDVSLKTGLNFNISNHYKIKAGTGFSYHFFNPATQVYKFQEEGVADINKLRKSYSENAPDFHLYMEHHLKLGKLFVNAGLRYNNLFLKEQTFSSWEPRLSFRYKLNSTIRISGAYSRMQQDLHLLTTTGIGMPVDLWLPATTLAPPENSEQYVLGFSKDFSGHKYLLSVEAYYKSIDNLIAYKPGKNFSRFDNRWEELILKNGTGESYGLEFLLQKRTGKHTGWLSYTWSKTNRLFSGLNKGQVFPFSYDRRHDFNIVYNYNIKPSIQFSAVWHYGSGYPYTMAMSKYYAITNADPWFGSAADDYQNPYTYDTAYQYSSINGLRMRDFHRLDIGANFIKQKKKGTRTWNVSIINVYNRQNPYFYYLGSEEVEPNKYQTVVKQLTLFPFFPSFSYSRSF